MKISDWTDRTHRKLREHCESTISLSSGLVEVIGRREGRESAYAIVEPNEQAATAALCDEVVKEVLKGW